MLLGYGYVIGIVAMTFLIRFIDAIGLPLNFSFIVLGLALLMLLGIWLSRDLSWKGWDNTIFSVTWQSQARWQKWLFGLLLTLILIRLGHLAVEILLRPLYPWDAWTTWAVRARVWFELKHLTPFVDSTVWLTDTHRNQYTIDAWQYPLTVSLISLWMAIGLGQWNESVNNIPWLLCAVALGLGFYGQARLWGASPLISLWFIYLLLSMPLLDVHIALAGYADLWMATVYGLAAIAFFQSLRKKDRYQGRVALMLSIMCPFIKLEGILWLLTFIPAWMMAHLGIKRLILLLGTFFLLLFIGFVSGGFSIDLPWLGSLHLTPELIQIPYLGRSEIEFNSDWDPFIQNFFVLANWHLLWYLAIFIMLISLPKIITNKLLFSYTILILTGFILLFMLFFMTEAQLWAKYYTSINRLYLHMIPVLVFYLLILVNRMIDRPFDTAISFSSQPD